MFPELRLRRLRQRSAQRRVFDLPLPAPQHFCAPLFICPGRQQRQAIASLPGHYRWSIDCLAEALSPLLDQGIGAVLLFGLAAAGEKTADGRAAASDESLLAQALMRIRSDYPQLLVISDVCLCSYTTHGHCGPLRDDGVVDNDASLEILAAVAYAHARAGADLVAPSAMMDGQVQAIRHALDAAGQSETGILSYSTKFASAFYGPFREAGDSAPALGDRRGYQTSYRNPRLARRESLMDIAEGADALMVKPALCYLDVIADLRARSDLPLFAYNVSGEYAMLHAAAAQGYGDLPEMVRESCCAIFRAGADVLISYWAQRYQEFFGGLA